MMPRRSLSAAVVCVWWLPSFTLPSIILASVWMMAVWTMTVPLFVVGFTLQCRHPYEWRQCHCASVYHHSHCHHLHCTAVIRMNDGSAIPYTTLQSFASFSTLSRCCPKFIDIYGNCKYLVPKFVPGAIAIMLVPLTVSPLPWVGN